MPEGDETDARRRGGCGHARFPDSIEGRASWTAAALALAILSIAYGAPLIVVVGLKPMTAALGGDRSLVALAGALVWLGTGAGGIPMGWLADRIGIRVTVIFGAAMLMAGLAISAIGTLWALLLGHAVFIGFLGGGAVYPPLLVYISRWFDRRRGIALALISSGQYIAGMIWPAALDRLLNGLGWQGTLLAFAVAIVAMVPLALFLRPPPRPLPMAVSGGLTAGGRAGLRLPANWVQALLGAAAFLCCVPMAMPSSHLVAFCTDVGISAARGAEMLSVLAGCALLSRLFWGGLADRIGGLGTVLAASACQALAIFAFTLTRNEAGLFAVSAAYGLGFSGIIPAYIVAIRELFPSAEASWRVPTQLFISMAGMAFGSWFAGALYDGLGTYAPAFAAGALFNLANLAIIGFLVARQRPGRGRPAPAAG